MADLAGRWLPTSLDGVITRHLDIRADERGSFAEVWRQSWTRDLGLTFTQANLSISHAGVLRGLHFHMQQTDLWVVLEGRAQVALVDLRSVIEHGEQSLGVRSHVLEMTAGDCVVIPPRVAHGFLAHEALRLLYLVTNEYDGTDERGFAWNDAAVEVEWRTESPTLSERDAQAASLEAAIRAVRQQD